MTSSLYIKEQLCQKRKKERSHQSSQVRLSGLRNPRKFFLVESASQGFGFGNLAQGFRIPTENGNPEYTTWNPESKTDSVYLTWGDTSLTNSSK